jgi:hypothetical protein
MATNPLAGLSRYIRVNYDEPEPNIIDTLFGDFAQRTDREILRANVELQREALRNNAQMAQRKFEIERLDKARRGLASDIQNTFRVSGNKPYFMIEKQLEMIAGTYLPLLGQDEVNNIMATSNPATLGMGDGYAAKSENNYKVIQRLSNSNLYQRPQEFFALYSMFDPTGDQKETFELKANKVAKDIMIKNRDIGNKWFNFTSDYNISKNRVSKTQQMIDGDRRELGLDTKFGETDAQRQDRLLSMLNAAGVQTWEETPLGQKIMNNMTSLENDKRIIGQYERYNKNPLLYLQEQVNMGEVKASQEVVDSANALVRDANNALGLNINLNVPGLYQSTTEPDSLEVKTETVVPDTTTVVPDTTTVVPDTTMAMPDTTMAMPDTTTVMADTTMVAQPDTVNVEDDEPVNALLSSQPVEVASGVYPPPKLMFDTMAIAESTSEGRSPNPDAERVNSDGSIDVGLVQINSDNVLEPGNDFGGDSNKIIKEGPDQGKPDLLWAKAQDMFNQEYGSGWNELNDREKMDFVKSSETVQKKFFNMWYAQRPGDFKALSRAMEMYKQSRPINSLNNVANVSMGNMTSEDVIRTELDSLGITSGGEDVEYNYQDASTSMTR